MATLSAGHLETALTAAAFAPLLGVVACMCLPAPSRRAQAAVMPAVAEIAG
jgi:hypothetical protein